MLELDIKSATASCANMEEGDGDGEDWSHKRQHTGQRFHSPSVLLSIRLLLVKRPNYIEEQIALNIMHKACIRILEKKKIEYAQKKTEDNMTRQNRKVTVKKKKTNLGLNNQIYLVNQ